MKYEVHPKVMSSSDILRMYEKKTIFEMFV